MFVEIAKASFAYGRSLLAVAKSSRAIEVNAAQRIGGVRALGRVRALCERQPGIIAGSGLAAALVALGYALFPWS
jgi:hypothetical protein